AKGVVGSPPNRVVRSSQSTEKLGTSQSPAAADAASPVELSPVHALTDSRAAQLGLVFSVTGHPLRDRSARRGAKATPALALHPAITIMVATVGPGRIHRRGRLARLIHVDRDKVSGGEHLALEGSSIFPVGAL